MVLPSTAIVYAFKRATAICMLECWWSVHAAFNWHALGNGIGVRSRTSPAIRALENRASDECAFADGPKGKSRCLFFTKSLGLGRG